MIKKRKIKIIAMLLVVLCVFILSACVGNSKVESSHDKEIPNVSIISDTNKTENNNIVNSDEVEQKELEDKKENKTQVLEDDKHDLEDHHVLESETLQISGETMYATIDLNVRRGPGKNNEKIGVLKLGEKIQRLEMTDDGWSKIIYCDVEGYVWSDYLSENNPLIADFDHEHTYSCSVVEPSCENNGYTTYSCECGYRYNDNETKKLNHSYDKKIVKPTYIEKGYDLYTCKTCGSSYKDNYKDVIPHEHEYNVITVAPTCTEKGYAEYVCTICNHSYKSDCKDVVAHSFKTRIVNSTCTEKGYTEYKCLVCEYIEKRNETPELGHDYETETVAPTPNSEGFDLHICRLCSHSFKDKIVGPIVKYKIVDETVYAQSDVNIRSGPGTDYDKLGLLSKNDGIQRVAIGDNGWSKVIYDDQEAFINSNYLTTIKPTISDSGYTKVYSDSTCTITIYKEWYENAYVYAAHIQFSDYDRLWVECANGKYNSGYETTSHAAKRVGAILAINGDYAVPGNGAGGYAIARKGIVCNDRKSYPEGVYNSNTGLLTFGHSGKMLSELVESKEVTDTFQFAPVCLKDGKIIGDSTSNIRAQRTFIGTNGDPGDIWLCVSDGRYNDGKSAGLNGYQCGAYLLSKGCTLGIPLDGGGSSTMYFNGKVLNAASSGQRSVVDFLVFK